MAAMKMRPERVHGPRSEEPLPSVVRPRRALRCPVCGADFVSQELLDEHVREEHHTA